MRYDVHTYNKAFSKSNADSFFPSICNELIEWNEKKIIFHFVLKIYYGVHTEKQSKTEFSIQPQ